LKINSFDEFCFIDLKRIVRRRGICVSYFLAGYIRSPLLFAPLCSPKPRAGRKSQRHNGLGFPILSDHLSDHGGEIPVRYGMRWTLPDENCHS
jgi:hypothetical protein